jgi:glycosyltransferase involved in cell wall biosynthesis
MFNQLKKKGSILTGHNRNQNQLQKKREYLLKKRQEIIMHQRLREQRLREQRLREQRLREQRLREQRLREQYLQKEVINKNPIKIYIKNSHNSSIKIYKKYELFIKKNNIHDNILIISYITCNKGLNNTIFNIKNQKYSNIKVLLIIEDNNIDTSELINLDINFKIKNNINIENILNIDCKYLSFFNELDIYKPYFLHENIYYSKKLKKDVICKKNFTIFSTEEINFYKYTTQSIIKFNDIKGCMFLSTNLDKKLLNKILNNKNESIDFLDKYFINIGVESYIKVVDNKINDKSISLHHSNEIYGQIFNFIFDKIFVINLKKDIIKKRIFIDNNKDKNINFSFIEGVYGKKDLLCNDIYNEYLHKDLLFEGCSNLEKKTGMKSLKYIGEVGYLKSMEKIFEISKDKYEKIIIFDDDIILHKEFNLMFFSILQQYKKEWNILRLGATYHNDNLKNQNLNSEISVIETKECDGSFGVCYSKKCFNFILNLIKKFNTNFDSGILRDCNNLYKNKDVTVYPFICIPDLYSSDIGNKKRNLMTYSKKFLWDLNNFNFVNSQRKVSIIIPLFNREKTIINCIYSLLDQTYKNIEIIIVNDCSTDKSESLILKFLEKYNGDININYIKHDINKGCYGARNTGIKASNGQFIAIQDSDDYCLPNRIEIQMNDIIKKNVLASYSSMYRMQNTNIPSLNNLEQYVNEDIRKNNLSNNAIRLGFQTSIINKTVFIENGLYDENYRHSLDQWYLLVVYLKKFNINFKNEYLNIVGNYNMKGSLYRFVMKNIDKNNFFYYNNKLTVVSTIMDNHNISNNYINTREKEFIKYLKSNNINI